MSCPSLLERPNEPQGKAEARTDLDVFSRQRDLGGAPVEVNPHPSSVAFTPGADAEQAAEAVAHAHCCGGHAHAEGISFPVPQRQRRY